MNNPAAASGYQMSCRSWIKSRMTDPASSLGFWIAAFAGMTNRRKRRGIKP